MTDTSKDIFLSSLKTKDNANIFFEFTDLVRDETYSTSKLTPEDLKEFFDKVTQGAKDSDKSWLEHLVKEFSRHIDPELIREELEELQKFVSGAELVKIEIAFTPGKEFLAEAYKILKDAGTSYFLLDVELNEKLKGGAKFFIGGKYLNLSLNAVVSKYLKTKDAIKRYL